MRPYFPPSSASLRISPGRPIQFLYGVAVGLTLASLLGQFLQHGLGIDARLLNIYVNLTDVDLENNIPTWFQSSVLLMCALMVWTTSRAAKRDGNRWHRYWLLLAAVFAFLSLDEFATLHEKTDPIVHAALNGRSVPTFAWVVLAIPAVLVFGVVYLRFLLALPARTRVGLIVAAAFYVGGAVGMELVGSAVHTAIGEDNMRYSIVAATEELFEMLGMITLLATISRYALLSATVAPRAVTP